MYAKHMIAELPLGLAIDSGWPMRFRWVNDYTTCDTCARLRKKGNVCPICDSVYKDNTPNMIQVGVCA